MKCETNCVSLHLCFITQTRWAIMIFFSHCVDLQLHHTSSTIDYTPTHTHMQTLFFATGNVDCPSSALKHSSLIRLKPNTCNYYTTTEWNTGYISCWCTNWCVCVCVYMWHSKTDTTQQINFAQQHRKKWAIGLDARISWSIHKCVCKKDCVVFTARGAVRQCCWVKLTVLVRLERQKNSVCVHDVCICVIEAEDKHITIYPGGDNVIYTRLTGLLLGIIDSLLFISSRLFLIVQK